MRSTPHTVQRLVKKLANAPQRKRVWIKLSKENGDFMMVPVRGVDALRLSGEDEIVVTIEGDWLP